MLHAALDVTPRWLRIALSHLELAESIALTIFAIIAVIGFRYTLWWVAAALAAHGLFDAVHVRLVSNPGVPPWWPSFCRAFDAFLAAMLSWLLYRGVVLPHRSSSNLPAGRL